MSANELDVAYQELCHQLRLVNATNSETNQLTETDQLAAAVSSHQMDDVINKLCESDAEVRGLDELVRSFEERVTSLKERLTGNYQKLLENDENEPDTTILMKELSNAVQSSKQQLVSQNDKLARLDKDVQFFEQSSKDGVFVWKIDKWSEVLRKAKAYVPYLTVV